MNIRLKLLLIFSLVSLSGLTFFGFVAYDSARVASAEKEREYLTSLFDSHHNLISSEIRDHGGVTSLLKDITSDDSTGLVIGVFDLDGNFLTPRTKDEYLQRQMDDFAAKFIADRNQNTGQFTRDDVIFTWFVKPIRETNLATAFLYLSKYGEYDSFFRRMGVPLFFTIFLVLWLSSWCAMYVATLLEKLNAQKNDLQYSATHDTLTKLPNRLFLKDYLDDAINAATVSQTKFALCFIDLNRFKEVNDTLGHQLGDELLVQISKRLRDAMRGSDTVARLGGDEFAIVMQEVDEASVEAVSLRVAKSIEKAVVLKGQNFYVSASIGIAIFPIHGTNPQTLIRNADVAMYSSKRSGNRITFYTDEMEQSGAKADLTLANDLREAIEKGDLMLFYQPKYDLNNDEIIGAEALVRWKHPKRGFVPPLDFVAISEKTGLIKSLTRWVIDRAFFDHTVTKQMGFELSVSINLSILNLYDNDFIQDVKDAVERYSVETNRFVFELTESAVMDNPAKAKIALDQLNDLGFVVSVDDFGTGYSSFINLRRLPIDEIKIDRSFVSSMNDNEDDASIVRATIELGKSLGINVVAEGVENEKTLKRIRDMGCHTAQGYLIGKPMPMDALLQHMARVQKTGKTSRTSGK